MQVVVVYTVHLVKLSLIAELVWLFFRHAWTSSTLMSSSSVLLLGWCGLTNSRYDHNFTWFMHLFLFIWYVIIGAPVKRHIGNILRCHSNVRWAVAHAENFHGGFWFMVIWWSFVFGVRCLWRHNLTSFSCFQTNVLAKFVDIICIFFYIHSPYFICHCTEYKLSALQDRLSKKKQTQRYDTAVPNCKIIRLRVKTGEWNTIIPTSEQFTTAKSGCAKLSSNKTSLALKVWGWTGWRTLWFARSNFANLHKNWECA